MKFGHKPKLTPQQIAHARKLIDDGQRREDVTALLIVNRATRFLRQERVSINGFGENPSNVKSTLS